MEELDSGRKEMADGLEFKSDGKEEEREQQLRRKGSANAIFIVASRPQARALHRSRSIEDRHILYGNDGR